MSGFVIESHGISEEVAASTGPALSGAITTTQPPVVAQRFIIFLFDDLHLSNEDLAHAQKASAKVIDAALTGSNMAAVVSISGTTNTGLIRDRAKLRDAIMSLRSRSLYRSDNAECPKLDYYQADQIENKHDETALQDAMRQLFDCSPGLNPQRDANMAERIADSTAMRVLNLNHQDIQATYKSMAEYIRRVATLPGERIMILVSPGFLSYEAEALTMESRLIDMAAQSNVTISALDARGVFTTELNASERSPGFSAGGKLAVAGRVSPDKHDTCRKRDGRVSRWDRRNVLSRQQRSRCRIQEPGTDAGMHVLA